MLDALFNFQIFCFILELERIKVDWGQKSRPSLALFDPLAVKFRGGGRAKCLSEFFFEFNMGLNM